MVAAHRHHKTFTKPAWRKAQAVLIPLAHAPSCVRCSIQWRATLADESKAMTDTHIGMIGYGEVGKIFSSGLKHQPGVGSVVAWDCQFAQPDTEPALITGALRRYSCHGEHAAIVRGGDPACLSGDRVQH
jgi:hypothetical protein